MHYLVMVEATIQNRANRVQYGQGTSIMLRHGSNECDSFTQPIHSEMAYDAVRTDF